MTERVSRLELSVAAGPETDAEELAAMAGQLREQLLELDIESAEATTLGQAPPGTRASEVLLAGALTVMLAHSSGLLTAVVETVKVVGIPGPGAQCEA